MMRYARLGLLFAMVALFVRTASPESAGEIARQIRFGTEQARNGNWREAIFRWQRALKQDPQNARLHNNVAVAYETLGEYEKADQEYRTALAGEKVPSEIHENYDLFSKFYEHYRQTRAPEAPAPQQQAPAAPSAPVTPAAPTPSPGKDSGAP